MKSNLFSLSIFLLWFGNTNDVSAQTPVLWIEDGVSMDGDNSYSISINLENLNEVGGFQFVMNYDTDIFSINGVNPTGRLSDIGLFNSETVPGQLSVLAISLTGDPILPGTGFVIQVNMILSDGAPPGASLFSLTNVIFTDLVGNIINSASVDGYFIIQGANILRMKTGFGMNDVNLYNNIAIGGIQSNLQFDNNIISVADIVLTERSQHMTLEFRESEPGNISILIYDLSNEVISSGTQSILQITLNIPNGSTSIINPLVLQDLVLTDISGDIIESQSLSGNYINILKIVISSPTVTSFNINNGASSTTSRAVTLNNSATGSPTQYKASESLSFSGASWLIYSTSPSFTLSSGFETKTVHFKVRNSGGAESSPVNDDIDYGAIPSVDSFNINNGASSTTSRAVTLNNSATGSPTQYKASESSSFSGASWLTYSTSPSFTLSSGFGTKTVYFKVENNYGESTPDQADIELTSVGIENIREIPNTYQLKPAFPNPFNPVTTIRFELPKSTYIHLGVYDMQGREIFRLVDAHLPAGYHDVTWNASDVTSGIYLYRLEADDFVQTRKMVLLK